MTASLGPRPSPTPTGRGGPGQKLHGGDRPSDGTSGHDPTLRSGSSAGGVEPEGRRPCSRRGLVSDPDGRARPPTTGRTGRAEPPLGTRTSAPDPKGVVGTSVGRETPTVGHTLSTPPLLGQGPKTPIWSPLLRPGPRPVRDPHHLCGTDPGGTRTVPSTTTGTRHP